MTSSRTRAVRPIRRALISVYDKTGLDELVAGAGRAGGGDRVHRQHGGAGGVARLPGDPGRGPDRVPRVPGRAGQDPAPEGARRTAGRPAPGAPPSATRRTRHRTVRPAGEQPVSVRARRSPPVPASEECVEQIDIGGPAMVRAAAKNHANVAVVTSPVGVRSILDALAEGGLTLADGAGSRPRRSPTLPPTTWRWPTGAPRSWRRAEERLAGASPARPLRRQSVLRYGENPHQQAALYVDAGGRAGLAQARQLGGKEMSYNNYVDADAAWRACHDFDRARRWPSSSTPTLAASRSARTSPRRTAWRTPATRSRPSAASSRSTAPVSVDMAQQVAEIFTEVVVAPSYEDGARGDPGREEEPARPGRARPGTRPRWSCARSAAACCADRRPDRRPRRRPGQLAAGRRPGGRRSTLADLEFAWRAVRSVKSNAILLASGGATVGVGMGQVNRVDAARLAVTRAGDRARGSVAASDAFFPFADGLQVLTDAGVRPSCSPAARSATTRSSRRRGGRRHALPHRHPALLPLIPSSVRPAPRTAGLLRPGWSPYGPLAGPVRERIAAWRQILDGRATPAAIRKS